MGTKRILIVDDMRTIQMVVPVYLMGRHYTFEVASSGAEALEKAKSFAPHLVISDVHMPEMSGYELCRALKGAAGKTPPHVVLISSTEQIDKMRGEAEEWGADAVLTKPISPDALADEVARLIGRGSPDD